MNSLLAVRRSKNSAKKGVDKKDEQDVTKIQEERQMSGKGEGVQKKVVETASDLGALGKEIEMGEMEDHEKDVIKVCLSLNKSRSKRNYFY